MKRRGARGRRRSHPSPVILSRIPEMKPSLPCHPESHAGGMRRRIWAEAARHCASHATPLKTVTTADEPLSFPALPAFSSRNSLGRRQEGMSVSTSVAVIQHCPHLVMSHRGNLTAESAKRTELPSTSYPGFCAWMVYSTLAPVQVFGRGPQARLGHRGDTVWPVHASPPPRSFASGSG